MDIMNAFTSMFAPKQSKNIRPTHEIIADAIKRAPEQLEIFERAYQTHGMSAKTGNLFDENRNDVCEGALTEKQLSEMPYELNDRIANNLFDLTPVIHVSRSGKLTVEHTAQKPANPVSENEITNIAESVRPQLTEAAAVQDIIGSATDTFLTPMVKEYVKTKDQKKKRMIYSDIRGAIDTLDVDDIIYRMCSLNIASMGYWLPRICKAISKQNFFKLPETRIARVPMTLYQMTRLNYERLTPSTLAIADAWARKAFRTDDEKSYFIKTGIFSSKFDFRNACVHGKKEVREIGQYLLFIQHQATCLASPLSSYPMYGCATTTDFVVREFIEDVENNPRIYKGLPLRTEYRMFIDTDRNTILGVSPYWRSDIMEQRFAQGAEHSAHDLHDYVVYKAHREALSRRYDEHVEQVSNAVHDMLPNMELTGQWSIDIMQNGNDFYIIDMAPAASSALSDVVPQHLLHNNDAYQAMFAEIGEKL